MSEEKALATGGEVTLTISDAALKSLSEIKGVTVGEIGTKVQRVPIEKYKASTQKIDRISFIIKNVMAIKMHYIDEVGAILCTGKKCCQLQGLPTVRYLFPVAVYSTDGDGNIAGKKIEIKILSAGEDLYKSIITIHKATTGVGGIDNVDLLVTCTDDKFQKITLNQAGPATWKKSPSAVQIISDKWAADSEFAYMAVARKVDEEDMAKLLGIEEGTNAGSAGTINNANPGQNNPDLESFFKED